MKTRFQFSILKNMHPHRLGSDATSKPAVWGNVDPRIRRQEDRLRVRVVGKVFLAQVAGLAMCFGMETNKIAGNLRIPDERQQASNDIAKLSCLCGEVQRKLHQSVTCSA